jgi:hypothetical protein
MQPIYPFTEEAIRVMNENAKGNPRELLKVADTVIDYASRRKTVQIGEDTAIQAIEQDLKDRRGPISSTSEADPTV